MEKLRKPSKIMTRNTTDRLNPLFLRQGSFAYLVEFVQWAEIVEMLEQLTLPNVPIYEIGYHNSFSGIKCVQPQMAFSKWLWIYSYATYDSVLLQNHRFLFSRIFDVFIDKFILCITIAFNNLLVVSNPLDQFSVLLDIFGNLLIS